MRWAPSPSPAAQGRRRSVDVGIVFVQLFEDACLDQPLLLGLRQRLNGADPFGNLGFRLLEVPVPDQPGQQDAAVDERQDVERESGTG